MVKMLPRTKQKASTLSTNHVHGVQATYISAMYISGSMIDFQMFCNSMIITVKSLI